MAGLLDATVFDQLDSLLFSDLCNSYNYFSTYNQCHAFANGVISQGICTTISDLFVLFRNAAEEYQNYLKQLASGQNVNISSVFNSETLQDACKIMK